MNKNSYWRNTIDQWGLISRLLHWGMALLIIGMLAVGLYMADLPNSDFKFFMYDLHKATGLIILLLLVFRLLWRFSQPVPTLTQLSRPHQFLAKMSVPVLYLVLLVMPISGIIMSQAGGYSINVYGWFTLIQIVNKNADIARNAVAVHQITGWVLMGLIILHILAALYHTLYLKDRLMVRMWRKK